MLKITLRLILTDFRWAGCYCWWTAILYTPCLHTVLLLCAVQHQPNSTIPNTTEHPTVGTSGRHLTMVQNPAARLVFMVSFHVFFIHFKMSVSCFMWKKWSGYSQAAASPGSCRSSWSGWVWASSGGSGSLLWIRCGGICPRHTPKSCTEQQQHPHRARLEILVWKQDQKTQ